jgi:hypothetical protein
VTTLVVPRLTAADELEPWPTLGHQIADLMEAGLVFGPGDLLGQPFRLDVEKRGLLYSMYEVYPQRYPRWVMGPSTGAGRAVPVRHPEAGDSHPLAGRRRFSRCVVMLQKGSAKSELEAAICFVELHPDGPVRCDGFDGSGNPIGRPVVDPYIPMFAYTEEQVEELAFRALYEMTARGRDADLFDIGLKRIMRKDGDGKAEAVAGSPNAVDGARTSHASYDETHRMILPHLKQAHQISQANLAKRYDADPWGHESTTAFTPGEGSIAEATHEYVQQVATGKIKNPKIFCFYRWAGDEHDFRTEEGFRAGVVEAAGPTAPWRNFEAIVGLYNDPTMDRGYLERVYGNRITQASRQAFDPLKWASLNLWKRPPLPTPPPRGGREQSELTARIRQALGSGGPHLASPMGEGRMGLPEGLELRAEGIRPIEGEAIAIGFDGSRWHDSTAIVGTHLRSRFQWKQGFWERPASLPKAVQWEVPSDEVKAAFAQACIRWRLARAYCDPPYWETEIAEWAGLYGSEKVVFWYTARDRAMAYAVRSYSNAILEGLICHDGDADLAAHLGHARKRTVNVFDDQTKGQPLFVLTKERADSPFHIDLAVAGTLSNEACNDAIADGFALDDRSVYEEVGLFI